MVWTLVEPGVAIIASSLATIRPLLRALRIRGFESTGRSGALPSGATRSYAMGVYPKNDVEALAIQPTKPQSRSVSPEPHEMSMPNDEQIEARQEEK